MFQQPLHSPAHHHCLCHRHSNIILPSISTSISSQLSMFDVLRPDLRPVETYAVSSLPGREVTYYNVPLLADRRVGVRRDASGPPGWVCITFSEERTREALGDGMLSLFALIGVVAGGCR